MSVVTTSRIAIIDLSPFLENDNINSSIPSKQDGQNIILTKKHQNQKNHTPQLSSAMALHAAFQDTGFAIVVNHGIPEDSLQKLRRLALKFFSFDVKRKTGLANGTLSNTKQKTNHDSGTNKAEGTSCNQVRCIYELELVGV